MAYEKKKTNKTAKEDSKNHYEAGAFNSTGMKEETKRKGGNQAEKSKRQKVVCRPFEVVESAEIQT